MIQMYCRNNLFTLMVDSTYVFKWRKYSFWVHVIIVLLSIFCSYSPKTHIYNFLGRLQYKMHQKSLFKARFTLKNVWFSDIIYKLKGWWRSAAVERIVNFPKCSYMNGVAIHVYTYVIKLIMIKDLHI